MAVPTFSPGEDLLSADVNRWMVPLVAWKPTDEDRTSTTTLAPDTDLTIVLEDKGYYVWEMFLYYNGPSSNGLKFSMGGAGVTCRYFTTYYNTAINAQIEDHTASDAPVAGTNGTGNTHSVMCHGMDYVSNGGSPSNFYLEWAQSSSSTTAVKLRSASYLLAWKVG